MVYVSAQNAPSTGHWGVQNLNWDQTTDYCKLPILLFHCPMTFPLPLPLMTINTSLATLTPPMPTTSVTVVPQLVCLSFFQCSSCLPLQTTICHRHQLNWSWICCCCPFCQNCTLSLLHPPWTWSHTIWSNTNLQRQCIGLQNDQLPDPHRTLPSYRHSVLCHSNLERKWRYYYAPHSWNSKPIWWPHKTPWLGPSLLPCPTPHGPLQLTKLIILSIANTDLKKISGLINFDWYHVSYFSPTCMWRNFNYFVRYGKKIVDRVRALVHIWCSYGNDYRKCEVSEF